MRRRVSDDSTKLSRHAWAARPARPVPDAWEGAHRSQHTLKSMATLEYVFFTGHFSGEIHRPIHRLGVHLLRSPISCRTTPPLFFLSI